MNECIAQPAPLSANASSPAPPYSQRIFPLTLQVSKKLLGTGAFSSVYLATDRVSGQARPLPAFRRRIAPTPRFDAESPPGLPRPPRDLTQQRPGPARAAQSVALKIIQKRRLDEHHREQLVREARPSAAHKAPAARKAPPGARKRTRSGPLLPACERSRAAPP